MTWTRIPLAQFASGYDAVIEFAPSVIDQQIQRQPPIQIPEVVSGPFSVPARPSSSNPPIGGQQPGLPTFVATLSLASIGPDHGLHAVGAAADVTGSDVALRITVLNATSTGRQTTALLINTRLLNQGPVTVWIPASASATVTLLLSNVPPGTHPLSVQIFDPTDLSVQTNLHGTLALMRQPISSFNQISPAGVLVAPNLQALGIESRLSASISAHARLTGPASADPSSSTLNGSIVLLLGMSVETEYIETKTLTTNHPFSFDLSTGKVSGTTISTEYRVDHQTVQAQVRLTLPIVTSVDPSTQAINVYGDLTAATVSVVSDDAYVQIAQSDLARQLQQAIRDHAAQRPSGARLMLTPRISLLGALQAGQTVRELSVSEVIVRALPGTPSAEPYALAVGIALAGNTASKSDLTNFLAQDEFAVVISGPVIKAMADFRWRTGDYPRVLPLTQPAPGAYKENNNTVDISIFTQIRQESALDAQGGSVASIRAAGPQTYGTSTGVYTFLMTDVDETIKNHPEDYLLLGGLGSFEVSRIVRKDNGQDVTAQVGDQYSIPKELQSVLFHWPFSMSFVGPPTPVADMNLELFIQALRHGVSQRLSRPFADAHMVSLSARHANGIENMLLSRGRITL
jgi:hypothetical protein